MNYFILTGASRGIGESICKKLLLKDHHLICVSRERNDSLISLANSKLDYIQYDLNNVYGIEELMEEIFEKVDSSVVESLTLINNAGLVFSQKIEETEPDSIIKIMNVNLLSPMILTSSFIKKAEQYDVEKRILNVSSGSSFNLAPGGSCYSTSKAGLETFTKSIGIETGNVKIMAIRPGMVDTDMHSDTVNRKNIKSADYAAKRILTFLFERFEHGKVVRAW
ncbi:SDR family NAD(P)-dependent oxidoreductase [Lederbergia sp. NSJ-179]|uniref:SDR family NAD(P)-dependent oxidoreductase n=1 Tax=Lederbergia sp. NSJ-179 TaxID=2931402 RepID=UPI001FD40190|nr:SDR family NAD(P)-dependent oxidoreductase [Lederbergia sp. NSJ-179]MCJ7842799.1 SDR family NAD(P)-dependent oxidoreductase [Lederbergia sp. NSJ-179]